MAGSSIRVVVNRTGISADTLRIWERRYGFPRPERTPGGSRLYSEEDIARLLLVNRALAQGYRPNEVVALPYAQLEHILVGPPPRVDSTNATAPVSVGAVIDALKRDDVDAVRGLLRAGALAMGPKPFVTDLAHPLAIRVGELWQEGAVEVRHEHVASACLTTTLRLLLSALEDGARSPIVVLATLPGEPHALALDMIAVYLAASGGVPRLVGADTPVDQIVAAAKAYRARAVGLSISAAAEPRSTARAVSKLARLLPNGVELWLGGAGATRVDAPHPHSTTRKVMTWSDLDAVIAHAARARTPGPRGV